jgi:hypothetical protein
MGLLSRFAGLNLKAIRGGDGVEKLSKSGHSGRRGQHIIAEPYLTSLQLLREFSLVVPTSRVDIQSNLYVRG